MEENADAHTPAEKGPPSPRTHPPSSHASSNELGEVPWDFEPGQKIGRYKLVRRISEGGFGMVWLAEQSEPVHREVALKLVKPGMDSAQVIARFEAERQTLAMMEHPNIAAFLDAGATEDGAPFFVMELVRGQPITTFCDENHIPVRERLELFIHVCYAVQHAHQKAILHRDLKPSNILVEKLGDELVPKVIDFGIAKAVGSTAATTTPGDGSVMGTPEYMSPEQAENDAQVDACSDIYSLGAILFELLTGHPPISMREHARKPIQSIVRHIRTTAPTRPSVAIRKSADPHTTQIVAAKRRSNTRRLSIELRGDIDWICLKALEKDRHRRYESAAALAADIQHYLKDEPVRAHPASAGYFLRKLVKRNRTTFVTISIIGFALLAGAAAATWNWMRMKEILARETAAKTKAEEESRRSKNVADFLANMVEDISAQGRASGERALSANDMLALLDAENERRQRELKSDPETDMLVARILARAYAELDRLDLAGDLYETASQRLTQIGGDAAASPEMADCLFRIAWTHHRQLEESGYSRRDSDDESLLRHALKLQSAALAPTDEPVVETQATLAGVLRAKGNPPEAKSIIDDLLDGPENEQLKKNAGYGWLLRERSLLLLDAGKISAADEDLNQARKILVSAAHSSNERKQVQADIFRVGRLACLKSGDLEAALNLANEELKTRSEWLGYQDPIVLGALAEIDLRKQDFKAGEAALREAAKSAQALHANHAYKEALRKLVKLETDKYPAPTRLADLTALAAAILREADSARVSGKQYRDTLAEASAILGTDEALSKPYARPAAAFLALRASLAARMEDYAAAQQALELTAQADPNDWRYAFQGATYSLAAHDENRFEVQRKLLLGRLAPEKAAATIVGEAAASSPQPAFKNFLWACRATLLHSSSTKEELQLIRNGLSRSHEPDDLANDWIALLMGMAEYRTGSFEDAAGWLDTASQSKDPVIAVQAAIVTAMNALQLHREEAANALKSAEDLFAKHFAPFRNTDTERPLHDFLATQLLLDEARALPAAK